MFEKPRIGQELLDVPMGDMIQQMAIAIADAQRKLDENSIDTAQMMGGLETITDPVTGEVTFSDSRVFFGKEKIVLGDAINTHNQTNDLVLRANIRQALAGSFTETNLQDISGTVTTLAALVAATGTYDDAAKVYKIGGAGGPYEYYKFVSGGVYNQVSQYSTNISKSNAGMGDDTVFFVPSRISMLELGFTPTFYQFVDTIIEVKISIKYTQEGSQSTSSGNSNMNKQRSQSGLKGLIFGGRGSKVVTTSHVNASYSQKYSYSAEGSSLLRTKLVPIPPPAILEERIRTQMDIMKQSTAPVTLPVTTTP